MRSQEINNVLDRWSSFLTKADQLNKDNIPKELAVDKNIIKAITAVDCMFDEEERMVYETRMQSLADVESKIASAEEKGKKEGKEEGKEESTKAIALNMLELEIDLDTISKATGLKKVSLIN